MIKVAFADDHTIVREGIAGIIESFGGYKVTCKARNGLELMEQIGRAGSPDIAILDLLMPDMDGYETVAWIGKYHPDTLVLILTSQDSEDALIPLVRMGIRGFLPKDIEKKELHTALKDVVRNGYYLGGETGIRLFEFISGKTEEGKEALDPRKLLTEYEIDFVRRCCSDQTYKEIAQEMRLSPRTIDSLRDQIFVKLGVRTRVTLAMLALRNKLVS
ncbi:MAG: response regulator transcription factor [Bacteroidetes bacterium]|nr:response regulator transcription factor [Bacteroidota bacterium]